MSTCTSQHKTFAALLRQPPNPIHPSTDIGQDNNARMDECYHGKYSKIQDGLETSISCDGKLRVTSILNEIQHLTDVEKLLLYLKLPTGAITDDSNRLTPPSCLPTSNRKEQGEAFTWIKSHFEEHGDVCMPKAEVYDEYKQYCEDHGLKPLCNADFGKIMKHVFPDINTRRLGQRGQSKYFYGGLRKRTEFAPPMLTELEVTAKNVQIDSNVLDSEIFKSSCEVICEWAEKLLDLKFPSVEGLAEHLLGNMFVNTKSKAAFALIAALQDSGKHNLKGSALFNSQPSLASTGDKHKETNLLLKQKLHKNSQLQKQKEKLQALKSEVEQTTSNHGNTHDRRTPNMGVARKSVTPSGAVTSKLPTPPSSPLSVVSPQKILTSASWQQQQQVMTSSMTSSEGQGHRAIQQTGSEKSVKCALSNKLRLQKLAAQSRNDSEVTVTMTTSPATSVNPATSGLKGHGSKVKQNKDKKESDNKRYSEIFDTNSDQRQRIGVGENTTSVGRAMPVTAMSNTNSANEHGNNRVIIGGAKNKTDSEVGVSMEIDSQTETFVGDKGNTGESRPGDVGSADIGARLGAQTPSNEMETDQSQSMEKSHVRKIIFDDLSANGGGQRSEGKNVLSTVTVAFADQISSRASADPIGARQSMGTDGASAFLRHALTVGNSANQAEVLSKSTGSLNFKQLLSNQSQDGGGGAGGQINLNKSLGFCEKPKLQNNPLFVNQSTVPGRSAFVPVQSVSRKENTTGNQSVAIAIPVIIPSAATSLSMQAGSGGTQSSNIAMIAVSGNLPTGTVKQFSDYGQNNELLNLLQASALLPQNNRDIKPVSVGGDLHQTTPILNLQSPTRDSASVVTVTSVLSKISCSDLLVSSTQASQNLTRQTKSKFTPIRPKASPTKASPAKDPTKSDAGQNYDKDKRPVSAILKEKRLKEQADAIAQFQANLNLSNLPFVQPGTAGNIPQNELVIIVNGQPVQQMFAGQGTGGLVTKETASIHSNIESTSQVEAKKSELTEQSQKSQVTKQVNLEERKYDNVFQQNMDHVFQNTDNIFQNTDNVFQQNTERDFHSTEKNKHRTKSVQFISNEGMDSSRKSTDDAASDVTPKQDDACAMEQDSPMSASNFEQNDSNQRKMSATDSTSSEVTMETILSMRGSASDGQGLESAESRLYQEQLESAWSETPSKIAKLNINSPFRPESACSLGRVTPVKLARSESSQSRPESACSYGRETPSGARKRKSSESQVRRDFKRLNSTGEEGEEGMNISLVLSPESDLSSGNQNVRRTKSCTYELEKQYAKSAAASAKPNSYNHYQHLSAQYQTNSGNSQTSHSNQQAAYTQKKSGSSGHTSLIQGLQSPDINCLEREALIESFPNSLYTMKPGRTGSSRAQSSSVGVNARSLKHSQQRLKNQQQDLDARVKNYFETKAECEMKAELGMAESSGVDLEMGARSGNIGLSNVDNIFHGAAKVAPGSGARSSSSAKIVADGNNLVVSDRGKPYTRPSSVATMCGGSHTHGNKVDTEPSGLPADVADWINDTIEKQQKGNQSRGPESQDLNLNQNQSGKILAKKDSQNMGNFQFKVDPNIAAKVDNSHNNPSKTTMLLSPNSMMTSPTTTMTSAVKDSKSPIAISAAKKDESMFTVPKPPPASNQRRDHTTHPHRQTMEPSSSSLPSNQRCQSLPIFASPVQSPVSPITSMIGSQNYQRAASMSPKGQGQQPMEIVCDVMSPPGAQPVLSPNSGFHSPVRGDVYVQHAGQGYSHLIGSHGNLLRDPTGKPGGGTYLKRIQHSLQKPINHLQPPLGLQTTTLGTSTLGQGQEKHSMTLNLNQGQIQQVQGQMSGQLPGQGHLQVHSGTPQQQHPQLHSRESSLEADERFVTQTPFSDSGYQSAGPSPILNSTPVSAIDNLEIGHTILKHSVAESPVTMVADFTSPIPNISAHVRSPIRQQLVAQQPFSVAMVANQGTGQNLGINSNVLRSSIHSAFIPIQGSHHDVRYVTPIKPIVTLPNNVSQEEQRMVGNSSNVFLEQGSKEMLNNMGNSSNLFIETNTNKEILPNDITMTSPRMDDPPPYELAIQQLQKTAGIGQSTSNTDAGCGNRTEATTINLNSSGGFQRQSILADMVDNRGNDQNDGIGPFASKLINLSRQTQNEKLDIGDMASLNLLSPNSDGILGSITTGSSFTYIPKNELQMPSVSCSFNIDPSLIATEIDQSNTGNLMSCFSRSLPIAGENTLLYKVSTISGQSTSDRSQHLNVLAKKGGAKNNLQTLQSSYHLGIPPSDSVLNIDPSFHVSHNASANQNPATITSVMSSSALHYNIMSPPGASTSANQNPLHILSPGSSTNQNPLHILSPGSSANQISSTSVMSSMDNLLLGDGQVPSEISDFMNDIDLTLESLKDMDGQLLADNPDSEDLSQFDMFTE